jgi:hypothetical protein
MTLTLWVEAEVIQPVPDLNARAVSVSVTVCFGASPLAHTHLFPLSHTSTISFRVPEQVSVAEPDGPSTVTLAAPQGQNCECTGWIGWTFSTVRLVTDLTGSRFRTEKVHLAILPWIALAGHNLMARIPGPGVGV